MTRQAIPRTALAKLMDAVAQPVFAVDDMRRILYVNPAVVEWLGQPQESLLGARCDYASRDVRDGRDTADAARDALCPPPMVFEGARFTTTITWRVSLDAEPRSREIEFLPCLDSAGNVVAVLGIGKIGGETKSEPTWLSPTSAIRLHAELMADRLRWGETYELDQLIGNSEWAHRLRRQVRLAATSGENVLIVGPTGSGKERLARTIHQLTAPRRLGPLIPLSCGMLDAELLTTSITVFLRQSAELETATTPTLLLLDVDGLSAEAQRELLGFLAIDEFDLRAIATCHAALGDKVAAGEFRGDLAARLGILTIEVPPLAARLADIPLLVQHFVEEFNRGAGSPRNGLTPAALEHLGGHLGQDNLDGLREVVRAAHSRAEGAWIDEQHLPPVVRQRTDLTPTPAKPREIQLRTVLLAVEREILTRALRLAKGNKSRAARLVGMSRAKFLRRAALLIPQSPLDLD